MDLASVIKTVNALSKLGESKITLDLRVELAGEVNDHSVSVALTELRGRVKGLDVGDTGA